MLSDVGAERKLNEDCATYVLPQLPDSRTEQGALALVADGMGGHAAGEVASAIAAEVVSRTYYSRLGDRHVALRYAFQAANRIINEAARADDRCVGMGTTCTALAIKDGFAYAASVGDSRLYLLRAGQITQVTEDHSLVMAMVKAGALSAEEARSHPSRNVILRALGTQSKVDVDVWPEPLQLHPGDRFVLCSDGLSDLVDDQTIERLALNQEPLEASRALIDAALTAGGYDNITVGIFILAPAALGDAVEIRQTRQTLTSPGV